MGMLLEKDLVHKITKGFRTPEYNRLVKVQLIESGGTGLGIPDIFFRTENDTWAEAKRILITSKTINRIRIPYQAGQYAWIKKYRELGGNALLICLVLDKFGTFDKKIYIFRNYGIQESYTFNEFFSNHIAILDYRDFDTDFLYTILNRR